MRMFPFGPHLSQMSQGQEVINNRGNDGYKIVENLWQFPISKSSPTDSLWTQQRSSLCTSSFYAVGILSPSRFWDALRLSITSSFRKIRRRACRSARRSKYLPVGWCCYFTVTRKQRKNAWKGMSSFWNLPCEEKSLQYHNRNRIGLNHHDTKT